MQKIFLLLLFAAMLTTYASAQTQSIEASWTTENTVVLKTLPVHGQTVTLTLPSVAQQKTSADLKTLCTGMTTMISTWQLTEDGKRFIIYLHRDAYPQWMQKEWEVHINRTLNAYVKN